MYVAVCNTVEATYCYQLPIVSRLHGSHYSGLLYTVKLGYNEQLGTGQICSLLPDIVITEVGNVVNMDLGPEKWTNVFIITGSLL